jgi:hypothetical protein
MAITGVEDEPVDPNGTEYFETVPGTRNSVERHPNLWHDDSRDNAIHRILGKSLLAA